MRPSAIAALAPAVDIVASPRGFEPRAAAVHVERGLEDRPPLGRNQRCSRISQQSRQRTQTPSRDHPRGNRGGHVHGRRPNHRQRFSVESPSEPPPLQVHASAPGKRELVRFGFERAFEPLASFVARDGLDEHARVVARACPPGRLHQMRGVEPKSVFIAAKVQRDVHEHAPDVFWHAGKRSGLDWPDRSFRLRRGCFNAALAPGGVFPIEAFDERGSERAASVAVSRVPEILATAVTKAPVE